MKRLHRVIYLIGRLYDLQRSRDKFHEGGEADKMSTWVGIAQRIIPNIGIPIKRSGQHCVL